MPTDSDILEWRRHGNGGHVKSSSEQCVADRHLPLPQSFPHTNLLSRCGAGGPAFLSTCRRRASFPEPTVEETVAETVAQAPRLKYAQQATPTGPQRCGSPSASSPAAATHGSEGDRMALASRALRCASRALSPSPTHFLIQV